MSDATKPKGRRYLLLLPLCALLVLVIMVKLKPGPQLKSDAELAPKVLVAKAEYRELEAMVSGYGRARAKETWVLVSEVSGRVIYRHPDLEKGGMLPQGTVALKIDPVDYQLKLAQAKSDLNSAKAEASRIALNKNKMQVSLGLEKNRLKILEDELKRKQGLLKQGSISRSAVDLEQANVFAQQQKVVDLETSIKLIPNDIEVAQARVQVSQSRLAEAQRALDKTVVTVPFDARITSVSAELEQVVNPQSVLIRANHIGQMQIPAQFSFSDIRMLMRQSLKGVNLNALGKFPDIRTLALKAQIKLYSGDIVHVWPGKVTRVSDTVDSQGNTIELIVEMENDWRHFDPLKRPPVLNDMFLEVNIYATKARVLTVPSRAVHGDKLYVAENGVLQVKPVAVLFERDGLAAIDTTVAGTVSEQQRVIVTDLLPALAGMMVRDVLESEL